MTTTILQATVSSKKRSKVSLQVSPAAPKVQEKPVSAEKIAAGELSAAQPVPHITDQAVDMTQEIHATVALHAFGECYGAAHGGVLEQEIHELPVSCRPDALPDVIKVDVTKLQVGEALTVGQLVLPEGVKVRGVEADEIVFNVVRPSEDTAAEGEGSAEPEAINEKKAEARAAEKAKK